MGTIHSSKFAGREVWLGDGKVRFDAAGVAVGVVKRAGRVLKPPEPVGPSQVEAAQGSPSFTVDGPPPQAAPAGAPVEPQEPPDAQVGPKVAPAPEEPPAAPAGAATGLVVGEPQAEAQVEDGRQDDRDEDLDDLSRPELYRLAQGLGLQPEWQTCTSDGLREQIAAERDRLDADGAEV